MTTYLVCAWEEDFIEDGTLVNAECFRDAAEEYVRLNFANLDYPEEVDVFVKGEVSEFGPVKFTVYASREVSFRAVPSEG